MTIRVVAADAGVSRPAGCRRRSSKYVLVVDALACDLRVPARAAPPLDTQYRFTEAVRRVDPRSDDPSTGHVMAEAERTPELLPQLREHGVRPRCADLALAVLCLQRLGAVREDVVVDCVVTLCFGSQVADHALTEKDTSVD